MAVALVGCANDLTAPVCTEGCHGAQATSWFHEPAAFQVDVLFVVDPALAQDDRFGQLVRGFAQRPFDLHVGLVPTSGGPFGSLVPSGENTARCGVPGLGFLATSRTCGARPNFEGSLDGVASCLARSPAEGPHQPLEAMRRALGTPSFHRTDGTLWVVIVSTRDDDSRDLLGDSVPVSEYVQFLRSVARDRFESTLVVSMIVPAKTDRLQQLADGLGKNAIVVETGENWSGATAIYRSFIDPGCLPSGLVDRDPGQPGIQPECVIEEWVQGVAGSNRILPPCGSEKLPCYELSQAARCESSLSVSFQRGGCVAVPGTTVKLTCAVEH